MLSAICRCRKEDIKKTGAPAIKIFTLVKFWRISECIFNYKCTLSWSKTFAPLLQVWVVTANIRLGHKLSENWQKHTSLLWQNNEWIKYKIFYITGSWEPNVIELCTAVVYKFYLLFESGKPFQPSLIFVGKARSLPECSAYQGPHSQHSIIFKTYKWVQ